MSGPAVGGEHRACRSIHRQRRQAARSRCASWSHSSPSSGAVLNAIAGLPHRPDPGFAVPDLSTVEALLRSSYPPLDGAIYVVGIVGWCIWGWLVLSLILQLVAAGSERIAGGTLAFAGFALSLTF